MARIPDRGSMGSPNRHGRVFGKKISAERLAAANRGAERTSAGAKKITSGKLAIGIAGCAAFFVIVGAVAWVVLSDSGDAVRPVAQTAAATQAKALPGCRSSAVSKAVAQALNEAARQNDWNMRSLKAKPAGFREVDATDDSRTCAVEYKTARGKMTMRYTVTWSDGEKGHIQAEALEAETAMHQLPPPRRTR